MKRFPFIFALLATLLVAAIPAIAFWLKGEPRFARMGGDINVVSSSIQGALCWPWTDWFQHRWWRIAVAFPWFLAVGFLFQIIHRRLLKGNYRYVWAGVIVLWIVLRLFPGILMLGENEKASKSVGTVARGELINGKRIPYQGANYRGYSFAGYLAGRTFVHGNVRDAILETYAALATSLPEQQFVIMETGKRFGGKILPHRTHQNGLSVDFMTPLSKNGKAYVASGLFNGWAYGRDFDNKGNKDDITMDYEVMAQHLLALEKAARNHGLRINKVIFDPVLQPFLFKTKSGKKLKGRMRFTRNRVVVRHDDHYHVDFGLR
ncbi:MAG: penicillin-insensitive murein endopeptidase [Bacteroidia bacterium]